MSHTLPLPYELKMSPFGGFLNCRSPSLGVQDDQLKPDASFVYPDRMIPSLGVQGDQLDPDASYVDHVLGAAYDIRLCEEMFNGWATHLDNISLRTEKPDERERDVRQYIAWLAGSARLCSEATNKILRCHAHFAYLMAWHIDGASKSSPKLLDCGTDTRRLADVIATAARLLSHNVVKMMSDLDTFVSYLEKMQVQREQSTALRILGWLKLLLDTLTSIFNFGSFIAPLLHPVAPDMAVVAPVASALCIAAAELCEKAAEQLEAKEPKSIESALLFLKKTVPKEARAAQKTLAQFDAALVSMGLEEYMTAGRHLGLSRPDSAAIAQEWCDVAKRYQFMLPDDGHRV